MALCTGQHLVTVRRISLRKRRDCAGAMTAKLLVTMTLCKRFARAAPTGKKSTGHGRDGGDGD